MRKRKGREKRSKEWGSSQEFEGAVTGGGM